MIEKKRCLYLNKDYHEFAVLFHKRVMMYNEIRKSKAIVAGTGMKKKPT